ncbi:MAG: ribosome maturation factor RimM [Polyangiaceae bacterium]
MKDDDWVPLAEVARAHGVRGELRLRLFNEDSDVLLDVDEVLVRLKDGTSHEVSVDKARRANEAILMKLYSVDDRDRADDLRGAHICVRRGDFPPLDDGEFYVCDITGAPVFVLGAPYGKVVTVRDYPTIGALVVKRDTDGREVEVPLVENYVERVDASLPEVRLHSVDGLAE